MRNSIWKLGADFFKRGSIIAICTMLTAVLGAVDVHAAKNAKRVKIKDPSRVSVYDFQGKLLACYTNDKGKAIPGQLNKKRTTLITDAFKRQNELERINQKILSASGTELKKLQASRKKIIQRYAARKKECETPQNVPLPTPTPVGVVPTPTVPPVATIPDGESLEPRQGALSAADVRYLLEKAAFGGDDSTLQALAPQGAAAVVAELMRQKNETSNFTALIDDLSDNLLNNTPAQVPARDGVRKAVMAAMINSQNPLRWRLVKMFYEIFSLNSCKLATGGSATPGPNPRQEGVTWDYMLILRNGATVPVIPNLVRNVVTSVMAQMSHDNSQSGIDAPSENLAEELLSRFTIGTHRFDAAGNKIRNYTKNTVSGSDRNDDVFRVAKALTGRSVELVATGIGDIRVWDALYSPSAHAPGPHVIFAGTPYSISVNRDEDLVPAIFASHEGAQQLWATYLLQEFVTPNPPIALVLALAQEIKANNFNLEPVLSKLLSSKAFWHAGYKNTIPKDPMEFIVESVKTLSMSDLVLLNLQNITTVTDYVRLTAATADATNVGMGYDFMCPSNPYYFPQAPLENGGGLFANSQFFGRLLNMAVVNANTPNPVWSTDRILPNGSLSVQQLIDIIAAQFDVAVTPDQRDEIQFFMDFVVDGNNSGLYPYRNTEVGNDIRGRNGKGMALVAMLSAFPGYHFR